jgi:hypothetical protein
MAGITPEDPEEIRNMQISKIIEGDTANPHMWKMAQEKMRERVSDAMAQGHSNLGKGNAMTIALLQSIGVLAVLDDDDIILIGDMSSEDMRKGKLFQILWLFPRDKDINIGQSLDDTDTFLNTFSIQQLKDACKAVFPTHCAVIHEERKTYVTWVQINIRINCIHCRNYDICPHRQMYSQCSECKGCGICSHSKMRASCPECKK